MDFIAYAAATAQAQETASRGGGEWSTFVLPVAIFAIFYFLLIRPQQKKAKQHKTMLAALKKGDRVITTGGLHGEVTGMTDEVITMEISPKIRVKVSRGYVAAVFRREGTKDPESQA